MSWGKLRKVQNFFHYNRKMNYKKKIKNGNESFVTISCKIKYIDSARFTTCSLSNLVDNLTKVIHKIKCTDSYCFVEYESVKDSLMKNKCLSCNKD